MSELTLAEAQMKSLDSMFDHLFGKKPKPESDELAQAIAAATDRDLHSVDAWLDALNDDVAYDDAQMKQLLKLAMEGDDMQFGVRLAQLIRRRVIARATQHAKDVFNGDARS